MVPRSSTTQLPNRKSPCTTVLSCCSGMCSASRACTRSTAGMSRVRLASNCACHRLQLTADQFVAAGEVAESDGVDVDRVQRDQRVDERLAGGPARRFVEGQRGVGVVQDDARHVRHHVERRADDVGVGAVGHRLRHGHRGRAERMDDAVLAPHVVRGGEHAVQRGSAQHELRPSASVIRAVMFDWPPTITCAANGAVQRRQRVAAHAANESRSMPVGAASTGASLAVR